MDANMLDNLGREWEAFKASNDARLKEIEKRGHADPLLEQKVDKMSAAIGEQQKALDDLIARFQRRGQSTDATDERALAKAEHAKALGQYLRRGHTDGLEELQIKAMSVGSDPDGGYVVTSELDSTIEKYERAVAPMRQVCGVVSVSNENYTKLRQSGTATTGWVSETEARTATAGPSFVALKPAFGELYANPGATQKLLDDAMFSIEGWLAEEVGLAFGEAENTAFTTGSGVDQPKGILSYDLVTDTDSTLENNELQKVGSGSSGAFVADKLVELVYALASKYREGAVFMSSRLGFAAIRKLKGSQNDHYMWQPSLAAGEPAQLLGYACVENDAVPVPAASAKAAIFGNFQRGYQVVDVVGTRVLRDPFTNKPYVQFYTTKRVGGHVVNNQAIKVQTLA